MDDDLTTSCDELRILLYSCFVFTHVTKKEKELGDKKKETRPTTERGRSSFRQAVKNFDKKIYHNSYRHCFSWA